MSVRAWLAGLLPNGSSGVSSGNTGGIATLAADTLSESRQREAIVNIEFSSSAVWPGVGKVGGQGLRLETDLPPRRTESAGRVVMTADPDGPSHGDHGLGREFRLTRH